MKLNFHRQLWTANDVYNSTVACLFASLQHFHYAHWKLFCHEEIKLRDCQFQLKRRDIFIIFLWFFIYFCRVAEISFNFFSPLSKCRFINSAVTSTFLNLQFPSYLHLYITLRCPHHVDVNIISLYPPCHCTFYTNSCGQTLCLFIWKKFFWIGNSRSQCCCLMQLLLLGWETSWMVNEYNMQIVVEWQMVLWCKKKLVMEFYKWRIELFKRSWVVGRWK